MDIQTTLQQAISFHQRGQLASAEQLYRQILARQPLNATALHYLGVIAQAMKHFPQALSLMKQSIQIDPANLQFKMNLIGLLDVAGRTAEAEAGAGLLVREHPDDLRLRAEFAKLLSKYGKHDLAADEWAILSEKSPKDLGVVFAHAVALQRSGLSSKAIDRYLDALALNENFGEACLNLSRIYSRIGQREKAREMASRAARLLPDSPLAQSSQAVVLTESERMSEGLELALGAVARAPQDLSILQDLAFIRSLRGEAAEAMELYRKLAAIEPQTIEKFGSVLMASLYVELTPDARAGIIRGIQQAEARLMNPSRPLRRNHVAGRKIRIGYVSPDFRNHAVGFFILPLLEHHDRDRFEIICFHVHMDCDFITSKIVQRVDKFYEAHASSNAELFALVRDLQIDILVDLAGHTSSNRLPLFAMRPAPLQVTYLGYPETTGMKSIDLLVTDDVADPPGRNDEHFSERLLRLKHSFGLFQPIHNAPDVAPLPADTNGFVTFGSIGRHEKWTDATLKSWASILRRLPTARLRLMGAGLADPVYREQRLQKLKDAGLDVGRISFMPRMAFLDFLKEIGNSDLLLDTFLFNGHTTTIQALYMGVPTVTLAGNFHRSRMGASLLSRVNLDELIAGTPEEFEEIAVRAANDLERLRDIRFSLRDRLASSSLSDAVGFAREFENALVAEWERLPSRPLEEET